MTKQPQVDRQKHVITVAARLIRDQGYDNTTVRDITSAAGMLPGSLYYHFPSKADLLYEVHRRGMEELRAGVTAAIEKIKDPWKRLEAACSAHVLMILEGEEHISVAVFSLPRSDLDMLNRLTAARDSYEDIYRQLVAELPLPSSVDRKLFRLTLLGSLNYAEVWDGDVPLAAKDIGKHIFRIFRYCLTHRHAESDSAVASYAPILESAANIDGELGKGKKENRREKIVAAAAHLFANRGYKLTSMRDIAEEAELAAGSIYYHFKSKAELFIAIVDEGTDRRSRALKMVLEESSEAWERLELTCAVHLLFSLAKNDFSAVISRPVGVDEKSIWDRVIKSRDDMEQDFREAVGELTLPKTLDKTLYLFVLWGAINTVHIWFRPHREEPAQLAHHIVSLLHPGK